MQVVSCCTVYEWPGMCRAVLKSKGGAADVLHLCTEEKTLECKYVETTNSLYLVPSSVRDSQV
jgi:hypothetical protein